MELRSLDYKFGGRNAEDTKREVNDLNKEIGVTREVRVTTLLNSNHGEPDVILLPPRLQLSTQGLNA